MLAELGVFSLCWAMIFSLFLVFVPIVGKFKNNQKLFNSTGIFVTGQFIFVVVAYFSLVVCFLNDDFSVAYVLKNSSLLLPWYYKFCAVWGGHEGSMLLWVVILSSWMILVSIFSKSLELEMRNYVLIILGLLSFGFILFILATSNPFLRQFQVFNSVGQDLNPLLQDLGFLFHPPMLYMGYVGFSVAFAFAIAGLLMGKIEKSWARWVRPWTLSAWSFLTLGITLGSWWAYRELGWGGWWFWDPVENASFMPWLVGTALIHSLIVAEKKQQFIAWTLLLAISAFSLSLVGTFLVRSGVLTSVHAFAVDPLRGLYILGFLLFVIGGSLILFMFRAHKLYQQDNINLISRESALLLNNVFFAVAMLTVLIGTVYPLLIDGLGLGKISVGAPYFNLMFIYIMMPMLLLMGLGVNIRWHVDFFKEIKSRVGLVLLLSLVLPWVLSIFVLKNMSILVYLSLFLSGWIILSSLHAMFIRIRSNGFIRSLSGSFYGMIIAHIGVAVMVLGISISNGYGVEEDFKVKPGDSFKFTNLIFKFIDERDLIGPNYHGVKACFLIKDKNRSFNLYPEKRFYDVTKMAMTDSAIDVGLFRDIYMSLGEPLDENSWSLRVYYKPLIRWIWTGGFMILLGGLVALIGHRYFIQGSKK